MQDNGLVWSDTIQNFIFSVYYVGASEMAPHSRWGAPKLPLRRERRKGNLGARRNYRGEGKAKLIFSQRDIDILKLIRWCQFILPEDLKAMFTATEVQNLTALGLIRQHEKSKALIMGKKGVQLLQALFDKAAPHYPPSYHTAIVQRRLRLSKLALTAYCGNVDIFLDRNELLSNTPSMFLSTLTRERGANPWGSTRVAAIAHLGDLFCAVHYVCPGIGKLALTDELTAFSNQTARSPEAKRAFLFAGESYKDILTELEADARTDTKLISYGGAYRCLQLPVHLLSCDGTGAVQLQIMAQPGYRTRLARAALKEAYQPPPLDVPVWDAIYQGRPLVIAADMDLRRLDAAIRAARERGIEQIAVVALERQAKEVLIPRYQESGQARVFALTKEAIMEVTGRPPVPYAPPHTQFLTEKGEVVDAPPIRIPGKAGGQAGRKARPMV